MIFAAALLAMALAGQPAKTPEKQGIAKGGRTQSAGQAENPAKPDQRSNPEMPTTGNVPTKTSEAHTPQGDEQIQIERTVEIFTGLLVIAAFLQAGIFFWQGRVFRRTLNAINRQAHLMRRQTVQMIRAGQQTERIISGTEDTAIRELRAYVCMSGAQIAFVQVRAPEVQVYIRNYGKTPAYNVQMWIGGAFGYYPPPEELKPPPPGFHMSTAVLAPGEKPFTMVWRHPEISEELMPLVGTRHGTLYIFGEVTYRDAFGKCRSTKYRLIHGGLEPVRMKDKNGIAVALLKPDTVGNEAD